jgi:hypothetical protein
LSIIQYVAILVALTGLGIIAFTVVFGRRPGTSPFGLSASKEGVKVETNLIGASLLVGLVVFLASGYFFVRDYEKQIDELKHKLGGLENEFKHFMERSKVIDLNASLQFPTSDADIVDRVKEASVYIKRDGVVKVYIYPAIDGFQANERVVVIPGLRPGDDVRIAAKTEAKEYRSRQEFRIPHTAIEMLPK